jgi:hypothetical protein
LVPTNFELGGVCVDLNQSRWLEFERAHSKESGLFLCI